MAATLVLAGTARGETSSWVGTYRCTQGLTRMALTIDVAADGSATALFHFYADPSNPAVPEGCYTMRGEWSVSAGAPDTRRLDQPTAAGWLAFRAEAWLLRPDGYVTVDIMGNVAHGRYQGYVMFPGCLDFALTPGPDPVPLPEACLPRPIS
jgi:hypothetical protein